MHDTVRVNLFDCIYLLEAFMLRIKFCKSTAQIHDTKNEVLLPEMNVPWFAAMADLNMMVSFGARERSEGEWNELARGVGLRIIGTTQV